MKDKLTRIFQCSLLVLFYLFHGFIPWTEQFFSVLKNKIKQMVYI